MYLFGKTKTFYIISKSTLLFVTGNTEIKFCFSIVIGFQYILSYYIYGVVETDKMIDMIKVFYDFVPGFVFKRISKFLY